MTKKNIKTLNNIQNQYLDKFLIKKLSKKFDKNFNKIKKDIGDSERTLNIIKKNYELNFKISELKKFKNFKTVVIIGMGGSILGTEAIYSFLRNKIKKNFYFFDDLNTKKISIIKKKIKQKKILFIVVSKSGETVETISNFLSLNVLKKKSKNIIIISEKKK